MLLRGPAKAVIEPIGGFAGMNYLLTQQSKMLDAPPPINAQNAKNTSIYQTNVKINPARS
jgi:hypothetical protein